MLDVTPAGVKVVEIFNGLAFEQPQAVTDVPLVARSGTLPTLTRSTTRTRP